MLELKPCPFCGGEAELQHREDRSFVECTVCGAQSIRYLKAYTYSSDGKAAEAWNRRTIDSDYECKWCQGHEICIKPGIVYFDNPCIAPRDRGICKDEDIVKVTALTGTIDKP